MWSGLAKTLFITTLVGWANGQTNPGLGFGMIDVFTRARNAIRLLELDSIYLNMPYGERNTNDIKFSLFTVNNPSNGQALVLNDSLSVESSNFDPQRRVKILIHGYTQNLDSLDFPQRIKDAYLNTKNPDKIYNVICVDWSSLSKEIIYFDSANYTITVGETVGEFVVFLKSKNFIRNYSDVHLVGFSLGAHVSGAAGEYIKRFSGGREKIGRISGLDPAGPGFVSVPRSERLDKDDADFCDVIHTNMGSIYMGDLGSTMFHGHADFYPNGGKRQPGCEYSVFREYSLPRRATCSHIKATEYYENSIISENKYFGRKCYNWGMYLSGVCGRVNGTDRSNDDNFAIMGENCDPKWDQKEIAAGVTIKNLKKIGLAAHDS